MKSLFRLFSPFNEIAANHPLFALESGRVRRLLRPKNLRRLSLKVVVIVMAVFGLWWVLAVLGDLRTYSTNSYTYYPSANQMITITLVISLLADGILDFACMVASINSFAGEVIAGRWDLLRLTIIPAEHAAAVKHAAARLRVWRMTTIVFALRLACIILLLIMWLLNGGLRYFQFRFEDTFLFFALVVIVLIYLVEPFWRARAVTALGLDISIRLKSSLSITLSAIGSVLALWILQPLIIGGIFYCVGITLSRTVFGINSAFIAGFFAFILTIFIGLVFYGFYSVLRNICIGNLINRLVGYEG